MPLKLNSTNGSITLNAEDGSGNLNLTVPRSTLEPRKVISTTDITTAVANVDITLPTSGYRYLELHLDGITPSASSANLIYNLSQDGGSNFLSHVNNNYSYLTSDYLRFIDTTGTDAIVAAISSFSAADAVGLDGIFRINIGPSTQQTTLAWNVNYNHATSGQIVAIGSAVAFNGASNSPASVSYTHLRAHET